MKLINAAELRLNLLVWMARSEIRTQKELARLSGVSRPTISKIMNGKATGVSLHTLSRLSKPLQCHVTDLINVKEVV